MEEGHLLRFRWWPSDDESQASEVTYTVEPDGDGSQLTITERPLVTMASQQAFVSSEPAAGLARAIPFGTDTWTVWDDFSRRP